MDDGDEWERSLWTAPRGAAFEVAAEETIAALHGLLGCVTTSSRETGVAQIEDSTETLRRALVVLGEAQLDFTGEPLFPILEIPEDFEDDSEPLDESADHSQFSLLVRRDYRVTSQASVLEEGRRAYRHLQPEASNDELDSEVANLGDALRHVLHAGGTDVLQRIEGLEPTLGITLFTARQKLLTDDQVLEDMDEPEKHFHDTGEVFVQHTDVWS